MQTRVACMFLLVILAVPMFMTNATAQQPLYGGTLIWGDSNNPPTLNPILASSFFAHWPTIQIFNCLAITGRDLKIVPDLAASWKVSDDKMTYTFYLVQNAMWHDGVALTSADVKFSIERAFDSGPYGFVYANLAGVETPDQFTVVVKFTKPFPSYLFFVDFQYLPIIAKHVFEGQDFKTSPANFKPIGTGPFMFKEYVVGDHITLVKNPNYFKKGLPYLDSIIFKIIPDASARVLALQKGDVHFLPTYVLPFSDAPNLAKTAGISVLQKGEGNEAQGVLFWLWFNPPHNKVLTDVNVRKAIAYALNKPQIIELGEWGYGSPGKSPIHSSLTWAFNPDVPKYDFNVAKAKQLLDDAGYRPGGDGIRFKLDLIYDQGLADWGKCAEVIRSNLKDVGIEVTLLPRDAATWTVKLWKDKDVDMGLSDKSSGPDPSIALSGIFMSQYITRGTPWSNIYYNNPKVDQLILQAQSETDDAKRTAALKQFQQIVMEDLPGVPLVERRMPSAYSADFAGFPPNSGEGRFPLESIYWLKGTAGTTITTPVATTDMLMLVAVVVAAIVIVALAVIVVRRARRPKRTT